MISIIKRKKYFVILRRKKAGKQQTLVKIQKEADSIQKAKSKLKQSHTLLNHVEKGVFTITDSTARFVNETTGQAQCAANLNFTGAAGTKTTAIEYKIIPRQDGQFRVQVFGLTSDAYIP